MKAPLQIKESTVYVMSKDKQQMHHCIHAQCSHLPQRALLNSGLVCGSLGMTDEKHSQETITDNHVELRCKQIVSGI